MSDFKQDGITLLLGELNTKQTVAAQAVPFTADNVVIGAPEVLSGDPSGDNTRAAIVGVGHYSGTVEVTYNRLDIGAYVTDLPIDPHLLEVNVWPAAASVTVADLLAAWDERNAGDRTFTIAPADVSNTDDIDTSSLQAGGTGATPIPYTLTMSASSLRYIGEVTLSIINVEPN